MEMAQLHMRSIKYAELLFNEGDLDDLVTQLQKFQDANNPRFVVEVISTYFEDSKKTLSDLNGTMGQQPIYFKKVDAFVQKLKGSSSRCMRCAAQIKQEYAIVKEKLQNLFRLEQQIVEAGGAVPVLYN